MRVRKAVIGIVAGSMLFAGVGAAQAAPKTFAGHELGAVATGASSSSQARAKVLAAKVNALRGPKPEIRVAPPVSGAKSWSKPASKAIVYSGNWSGYVNTGHSYSVVGSTFVQPTVTCLAESYAVWWVGLDGYGSGTVEQGGTAAYCSGSGAIPEYFDWWELYPQNTVQGVALIAPGDHFRTSVNYWGSQVYQIQVVDTIHYGQSFDTYQTKTGAYANRVSAEYIVEAPSGSSQYNLAEYALTTFTNDYANVGSTSHWANGWPNTGIDMDPNGHVIAAVGGLYTNGLFYDWWLGLS